MEEALKRLQAELGNRKLDKKAGASERRKVHLKWCEDQRHFLRRVYGHQRQIKERLHDVIRKVMHERNQYMRAQANLSKMMRNKEGTGPLPPKTEEKDETEEESEVEGNVEPGQEAKVEEESESMEESVVEEKPEPIDVKLIPNDIAD